MQKKLYIWFSLLLITVFAMPITNCRAQAIDTVCASGVGQVYRVKQTPGSIYFWWVDDNGGSITSKPYLDSVNIRWHGKPGIYTIKVVEQNKFGCLGDTVSAQVLIREGVSITVKGPVDICAGEVAVLTAFGGKRYLWSTGETTSSILINPAATTNYSVVGFDDGCYSDTEQIVVNVHAKPKADFTYKPVNPEIDEKVTFFYKGSSNDSIEWTLDKGNTIIKGSGNNNKNAEYTYVEPGVKEVTLVVKNKAGCTDVITYKLFVNSPSQIFVPTAFTPDGDNLNDVFKPVMHNIKSVEMVIYSRWGEEVYRIDGVNDSWDGLFHNKIVEQGMYYYTLKAQGIDNRWHYLNGNVSVIY